MRRVGHLHHQVTGYRQKPTLLDVIMLSIYIYTHSHTLYIYIIYIIYIYIIYIIYIYIFDISNKQRIFWVPFPNSFFHAGAERPCGAQRRDARLGRGLLRKRRRCRREDGIVGWRCYQEIPGSWCWWMSCPIFWPYFWWYLELEWPRYFDGIFLLFFDDIIHTHVEGWRLMFLGHSLSCWWEDTLMRDIPLSHWMLPPTL